MKKKLYAALPVLKRVTTVRNLFSYKMHGRKPWSRGYFEHKWSTIAAALKDNQIMEAFCDQARLPRNFGMGLDERVVEYPWLVSHLPRGPARLLDAGSALNFEIILNQSAFENKKITIVNLNPEPDCFWRRGISYLFEDIRHLPFSDGSFDLVTSISTLEHVGMDNTKDYIPDAAYKENRADDYLAAAAELRRVLAPGGRAFISVPFGLRRNFGSFQQFDATMLEKLAAALGGTCSYSFFRYSDGSWQTSTREDCVSAEYVPAEHARKGGTAAAAGAVACLKIVI